MDITIPANAAAGTWVVDRLDLTDLAGNTAHYTGLNAAPLMVSANRQIEASGFAFDPPQVDNWRTAQVTHLKFTVSGLQQGLDKATLRLSGACSAETDTPAVGDGGVVDIPVTVRSITSSCTVTGLMITDGAGNASLYGTYFGAPDLGLRVTRIPNTTPPVVDSVRLSWTTLPEGNEFSVINNLIAHTVSPVGITECSVTVFDSSGASVGGGGGGAHDDEAGNVTCPFSVPGDLPPGTYTVGFTIRDASGLFVQYGYPNRPPPPGGPLTPVSPAS